MRWHGAQRPRHVRFAIPTVTNRYIEDTTSLPVARRFFGLGHISPAPGQCAESPLMHVRVPPHILVSHLHVYSFFFGASAAGVREDAGYCAADSWEEGNEFEMGRGYGGGG
jgi:hypothetical protein